MALWTVTVGGFPVPWTQIEVTFEQFHTPAQFAITLPLRNNGVDLISIPLVLADLVPEVVVRCNGLEFFVGDLDESEGDHDDESEEGAPEGILDLRGRDLSSRLLKMRVDNLHPIPPNGLASTIVLNFLAQARLIPTVIPTAQLEGDWLKHNYHRIARKLSYHDIIYDLAAKNNYIFRVDKRIGYFGPPLPPTRFRPLIYRKDFAKAKWRKSHMNNDVRVRVYGYNRTVKQNFSFTAGLGSLTILHILEGNSVTLMDVRTLALRMLADAERGIQTVHLQDVPGDPTLFDVNVAFPIVGLGAGIDGLYFPTKIHHVITQDDHVMDLELYNSTKVLF